MTEISIKRLSRNDWRIYKELRMQMLTEEPQAYSQTLDEVVKRTDEEWMDKTQGEKIGVFAAFVDEETAGMNGLFYEKEDTVAIWGMFVKKEFRGMGIGKKLMEEIEREIRKDDNVRKIQVSVTSSQITAWELYKKMGFREIKRIPNQTRVNGKPYDEIVLEKTTSNV